MHWLELSLGTHTNPADTEYLFKLTRCFMHDRARGIVPAALAAAAPKRALRLVLISVEQLGFADGATYREISERAFAIGYAWCPARSAIDLRLVYRQTELRGDLRRYNVLHVAMEPILNSMGSPFAFVLWRAFDSDLLYADFAHEHTRFHAKDIFVFWSP